MAKAPVTALVLTKNEERAIGRCLAALAFCDQVIVVDSSSSDATVETARAAGALVVQFAWNGQYPKKKQWAMDLEEVRHDWVLHIDADEIVTDKLAREISDVVIASTGPSAYEIPITYSFLGKRLRYGHQVVKRSLVRRSLSRFPEVGDLGAPGITEVEGHYQPLVSGIVGKLQSPLLHEDPDPISDWISRHNRYAAWEAYLAGRPEARLSVREHRSRGGAIFDRLPFKPLVFFLYSFVLRRGFLDGRQGFDYAFALAWYYWLVGANSRDPFSLPAAESSQASVSSPEAP